MKEVISKFCWISLSGKCQALQSIPMSTVQVDEQTLKRISFFKLKNPHLFSCMDLNNTFHVKDKWETGSGTPISSESWEGSCEKAHLTTSSNYWREFKWKIIR